MLDHRVNLLNSIGFVWNQLDSTLDVMFQRLERIKRLESIVFIFRDVYEVNWMKMFNRLVLYKKQHKSTNIRHAYTDENNGSHLCAWAATQRTKLKKGKLLKERMDLLNSIDFAWVGR
ncbi:hypothetical protein FRACYDRAFT_251231 [Fragilariopsis cylindrus CCMP1102]|uniref:Helicase-associated domain-containing protein n=1 Tax=Fragilariopsis cylindrus CCMP1102 TaxID=635003 RepID=A0A1E7ENM5_9STRA|nr:hypothetical protein FRACYDRAFT_251231 [Fragilariopsis cylindrus CCMP1102]|eukprot:OEU07426.1 hypothetical protein FRACYDRAFT_251231 [Fragilariopsis cylindrus CCMP1102]